MQLDIISACIFTCTGLSMVSATSVLGAALVTWGHADGVVRVKLKKEQPPLPVVKSPGLDPVNSTL